MDQITTHDRSVPGRTIPRFPRLAFIQVDIEWESGFPIHEKRRITRRLKMLQIGGKETDSHIRYQMKTPEDPFTLIAALRSAPGVIEASIGSLYAPGEALPQVFGLRTLF